MSAETQKQSVRTKKSRVLYRIIFILLAFYILWRFFFTLPLHFGVFPLVLGILLAASEAVSVLQLLENYRNSRDAFEPECPEIPAAWYPDVDVLIATHNESCALLHKTVNGCLHMEYPDPHKVHIFLCDDTDRSEVRQLAQNMGVGYFGLSENRHKKAGNLNNALRNTHSPLVATFDADMVPMSSFLMETVPYFFLPRMKKQKNGIWAERAPEETDPRFKIGFVQAPQSFYNPDLFQYNLYSESAVPNEQDYFFREINVGRNATNSAIYAGSNTVISRQALEDVGYIVLDCITEDFSTGMLIQAKGYTTYAVSKILAHGLSPSSIPDLIRQRERWGRGCVQSFRRTKILRARGLPPASKFSYVNTILYWWTFFCRMIFIISPLFYVLLGVPIVYAPVLQLLLIWIPAYLLQLFVLKQSSGNIRTARWSNIIDTILFPYLVVPILAESLGIQLRSFNVTRKDNTAGQSGLPWPMRLPHFVLAAFSAAALGICVYQTMRYGVILNFIVIFWLCVNLYSLALALFFTSGRKNLRGAYRFAVRVPATIRTGDVPYAGQTRDLSETGFRIELEQAVNLPPDDTIEVCLNDGRYRMCCHAAIVHVQQTAAARWNYSFRIAEMSEENRRAYEQLLLDREFTFPKYITPETNTLDDFSKNILSRMKPEEISKRRRPRLLVHQWVELAGCHKVLVLDFDFVHIRISTGDASRELPDHLDLTLAPGVTLSCRADSGLSRSASDRVFVVENIDELMQSETFHSKIGEWSAARKAKVKRKLGAIAPDELDLSKYL